MKRDYYVYQGDAETVLQEEFKDDSMHLGVTSPPYGPLVKYSGKPEEIGFNQKFKEYAQALMGVWIEMRRVLKPGCWLVVNVGNAFIRKTETEPFHMIPTSHAVATGIGSLKNMDYMGTIIWKKVSTTNNSGGGSIMDSNDYPRDGHFLVNSEDIHFFRKRGKYTGFTEEQKKKSRIKPWERKKWFVDTWNVPGEKKDGHPAAFPIEIPERIIRMRSMYGEDVVDPFVGSGSTLAACKKTNRIGYGIDLGWGDSEYDWRRVIKKRVGSVFKPRDVKSGF